MKSKENVIKEILLPVSKSLYQRLLLFYGAESISGGTPFPAALTPHDGMPRDCLIMHHAITSMLRGEHEFDTLDNGTALRFMSALASLRGAPSVFNLSNRQPRPMTETLDALKSLGADVRHTPGDKVIISGPLSGSHVCLTASTTSQHVSALMLIAPSLPNGLEISIEGDAVSSRYINLTVSVLASLGVDVARDGNVYRIAHREPSEPLIDLLEPDWSSAAFAYESVLTGRYDGCLLMGLSLASQQPERAAADIFATLGVKSIQEDNGVLITREKTPKDSVVNIDARQCPDSVLPLVVGMAVCGVPFNVSHAAYLRGKESNRIEALRQGLEKMGIKLQICDGSISFMPESCSASQHCSRPTRVSAHGDHRIAMAFGSLPPHMGVVVDDKACVVKSFPDFWLQFE